MMASRDQERFGRLRYRADQGWVGRIHLPRFAECRDAEFEESLEAAAEESVEGLRERTRQARRRRQRTGGRFQLVVEDFQQAGPTEAQRQAIDFLLEREAEVLEAVVQWILDVYRGQGYWTLEGFVRHGLGPAAETPGDVKRCIGLESVVIHEAEADGRAPVTFYFSSSLDVEHGVEVTTAGAAVVDSYPGEKLLTFPFALPDSLNAGGVEPSADGHRFVELKYGGRWSGIFVLDPSLQCVGVVADSFPRRLPAPREIEDVRALTPLRRWRASTRVRRTSLTSAALANWFVGLPCLVVAWLYEPRLFWVSLAIGLGAHAAYFAFRRSRDHVIGLATAQIVLSSGGLIYAHGAEDFGSEEHAEAVTGVFELILWWGTCAVAAIAALVLAATIVSLRKELVRDARESFLFILPGLLCVAVLAVGLLATSVGRWSAMHLLWLTPATLAGSLIVFFATMILASSSEANTPCPDCGKPLASPKAKQCLHCGADWHENR
ncbi:MAG: hypothetical protein KY475_05675 [Planctomycetes bacterium]|nr:hypothetical protein [Planctomycetota bacterium]